MTAVPSLWKRRAGEATAVLAGVLLALSADAAWDYRNDRTREQAYLGALHGDFLVNRERIASILASHRRVDASALRLLSIIDSAGRATVSRDSVNQLLDVFWTLSHFDPVVATYDDLVHSGNLTLLRDDTLRTALAQFGREQTSLQLTWQYAADYWSRDLVTLYQDETAIREILAASNMKPLGRSRFSTDIGALIQNRRFENHIVTRLILGLDLIRNAEQVAATVDAILLRLERLLRERTRTP